MAAICGLSSEHPMDFLLPGPVEALRRKVRKLHRRGGAAARSAIAPITMNTKTYRLDVLDVVRGKAKALGPVGAADAAGARRPRPARPGWAAVYEEANRSIFGPVALNCAAPDDGNMSILDKVLPDDAMRDKWLHADHRGQGEIILRDDRAGAGLRLRPRRHDADAGGAPGRPLCRSRPQMVHLGSRCGPAFHSGRAHLR